MISHILLIKPYLEVLALTATFIGLPILIYQIRSSRITAAKARDMEIALDLVNSFRASWESGWRKTLLKLEENIGVINDQSHLLKDETDELLNMLNWVDWLGNLVDKKFIYDDGLLKDFLQHPIKRILHVAEGKLERDNENLGSNYWRGISILKNKWSLEVVKPNKLSQEDATSGTPA